MISLQMITPHEARDCAHLTPHLNHPVVPFERQHLVVAAVSGFRPAVAPGDILHVARLEVVAVVEPRRGPVNHPKKQVGSTLLRLSLTLRP